MLAVATVDDALPPVLPFTVLDGGPLPVRPRRGRLTFRQAVAILRALVPVPATRWEQLTFPAGWLGPALPAAPAAIEPAGERGYQRSRQQLTLPWPPKWWRRRHSSARKGYGPRVVLAKGLTEAERKASKDRSLFYPGWDRERPRTRADCARVPRPCPWVSCRHHLFLDCPDVGQDPRVKLNFPGREPAELPATGSCSLDVAERASAGGYGCQTGPGGGVSLDEVGRLLGGLSLERVRQLSAIALQNARVAIMRTEHAERLVQIRYLSANQRQSGQAAGAGGHPANEGHLP